MLPSTIELQESDITLPPPSGEYCSYSDRLQRVSTGSHKNGTKNNCRAAERFQNARNARRKISVYWAENQN